MSVLMSPFDFVLSFSRVLLRSHLPHECEPLLPPPRLRSRMLPSLLKLSTMATIATKRIVALRCAPNPSFFFSHEPHQVWKSRHRALLPYFTVLHWCVWLCRVSWPRVFVLFSFCANGRWTWWWMKEWRRRWIDDVRMVMDEGVVFCFTKNEGKQAWVKKVKVVRWRESDHICCAYVSFLSHFEMWDKAESKYCFLLFQPSWPWPASYHT